MENILFNKNKIRSIENIIKETSSGRNSSFAALKWLEENGFIKVNLSGNQKLIELVLDNYTIQYKYYLDSIEFKSLNPVVKLIIRIFISEVFKDRKIKAGVLFGSVLKSEKYNDTEQKQTAYFSMQSVSNETGFSSVSPKPQQTHDFSRGYKTEGFGDIDILLLGENLEIKDIKDYSVIKEKIERLFDVILNIHIGDFNVDNLFKGIVIYQSSYLDFKSTGEEHYFEFLNWFFEALKNRKDKKIFDRAFENAVINLSYAYCYFKGLNPKTKEEALNYFVNKEILNIDELKKRGIEVGKKIFI